MGKLSTKTINGIKFFHREGTSDLKAFEEVIGRNVYQKRGIVIEAGETWLDCGGNVGAFALLACSLGAKVIVYEPDPNNCKMIKKNLFLNGFKAEVNCAALVADKTKKANLFIGNKNQVWRNSLHKNWNGKVIEVDCINFDKIAKPEYCVKMDIEGAEMPILEATKHTFKKMVYEWSFDIDPSLSRFWRIIDKQKLNYDINFEEHRTCYDDRRDIVWQKSWFPACTNVYLKSK